MKQKIILVLFGLILPGLVSAQVPRLEVEFIPDPLFSESSIMPGDAVSGIIRVTNNTGEDQTVITEAINVSDPLGMSAHMDLTITDDSLNTYYTVSDGTFFDFLTGGVIDLTDAISNGETVEYEYLVSFDNISDNTYQLAELGFDLCVGFKDELTGMNCGDTVVSPEGNTGGDDATISSDSGTTTAGTGSSGGGGGGGGNPNTPSLLIFNEQVLSVDDVLGTAVIAWDTNLYSTSQVVYGLASDGPYNLSAITSNFGYPLATVEDTFKVIHHEVELIGLTPGETYNFRVVSRASPPTVSYEYEFKVEKKLEVPTPNPFAPLSPTNTISLSGPSSEPSTSGGGGGNLNIPQVKEPVLAPLFVLSVTSGLLLFVSGKSCIVSSPTEAV
jgi:hypothetical protein